MTKCLTQLSKARQRELDDTLTEALATLGLMLAVEDELCPTCAFAIITEKLMRLYASLHEPLSMGPDDVMKVMIFVMQRVFKNQVVIKDGNILISDDDIPDEVAERIIKQVRRGKAKGNIPVDDDDDGTRH